MGQVYYDVPMVRQEANPICWLACVAMIMSYYEQASVTIGSINGGFDPSNSCMGNPVSTMAEYYYKLESYGFTSINPKVCPAPAYVEGLLTDHGPFILTHLVGSINYGGQYTTVPQEPNSKHAVVITGVDTDAGIAYMNNPWGDKDQILTLDSVLLSMSTLFARNERSVAYMD